MQPAAAAFVTSHLEPIRDLVDDFVLVGGATIGLWLNSAAVADSRPTNDVDLVIACENRGQYENFAIQLRRRGLSEDSTSRVICRWRDPSGRIYDVMPTNGKVFGFGNRWYETTVSSAQPIELSPGFTARCATPPLLIAMKLEAYADRGEGWALASHDYNDVIALIDGRSDIVDDMRAAPQDVRDWIAEQLDAHARSGELTQGIAGYLPPSAAGQARSSVIRDRIDAMFG